MTTRYRRILVIGISGAGKTTFARRLAAATGLPLVHLDREHWLPNWTEPDKVAWRAKVTSLIASDCWIMDGNYTGTFDIRMRMADAIVWFDYRPIRCIARVVRRVLTHWQQTRPDMAEGCPERLDRGFLVYIWQFRVKHRPIIERAVGLFGSNARLFRVTGDGQWGPLITEIAA